MGRKRRMVDGCAGAALRSAPANSAKRMPMWGWDCQAYVAACVIAPAPGWGSGTNSQEHSSPGACWGGRASCQHGGSRAGAGSNVGEAGGVNPGMASPASHSPAPLPPETGSGASRSCSVLLTRRCERCFLAERVGERFSIGWRTRVWPTKAHLRQGRCCRLWCRLPGLGWSPRRFVDRCKGAAGGGGALRQRRAPARAFFQLLQAGLECMTLSVH